jgi:hypothetical protein
VQSQTHIDIGLAARDGAFGKLRFLALFGAFSRGLGASFLAVRMWLRLDIERPAGLGLSVVRSRSQRPHAESAGGENNSVVD